MKVYTDMDLVESLNCLNRLIQEVITCAPALILMIFFCELKIFPLLSQKIIPYFIIE